MRKHPIAIACAWAFLGLAGGMDFIRGPWDCLPGVAPASIPASDLAAFLDSIAGHA